jgi:hypothetical protein
MQADYNPSATPSIDRKAGVLRYCYRMAIYVIMLLSSDSVEAALFYCFGSSPALRPFLEKKGQRWSNSLRFRFASQLSLVCRFHSVPFLNMRGAPVPPTGRIALYMMGAGF